jgi:hypothetical protein
MEFNLLQNKIKFGLMQKFRWDTQEHILFRFNSQIRLI